MELKPPEKQRNLFKNNDYLSVSTLDDYETVIAGYRRAVEVAEASQEVRHREFRKLIDEQLKTISGTASQLTATDTVLETKYVSCGNWSRGYCTSLRWPGFSNLLTKFHEASRQCKFLIESDRYTDHVTPED